MQKLWHFSILQASLEDIDMKNKNKSARLLLSSEIDSRWLFMKKNFRLLTELNRPGGTYC